jgi:hypothetical protein
MRSDEESSLLALSAKRKCVLAEAIVTHILGQLCELVQDCELPGQCLCLQSSVYMRCILVLERK